MNSALMTKRVATITCHRVINHGAMLQELALPTFLCENGYDASIINYVPFTPKDLDIAFRTPARYDYPIIRTIYQLRLRIKRQIFKKRWRAFMRFFDKYIVPLCTPSKMLHTLDALRSECPAADTYVAGSDQIWNTRFSQGTDPAFYLDFGAPDTRRISYAASFATDSIAPEHRDFVQRELGNFDAISVRENSGLRILKSLGYDGVAVCDPVFLLDRDYWDIMDGSVEIPRKPYIVVYDFEKSEEVKNIAQRIARLKGYKIVSVSPYRLSYANYNFINNGPDAFVSLIKHSSCVISNSFHGSAFALIFQKDFFVVNRTDGLNRRMADLLSRYGISARLVSSSCDDSALAASIDYSAVTPLLEKDISFSREWLLSNV